ncbi:restriction endonuclease subunit S [Aneurinibacillus sp. BA2021]|nr:restriction endonuclease subunit S [Aneurinibacillus sp. BA2021]
MKNWRKYEFGEVVTLSKEKYNPKKEKDNFICIELEHLESDTGRLLGHTDSLTQQSVKNKFKPGSVLFGKLRPYLKKFHLPNFHGVCSSEIWVLEGNEGKLRNEYLYCLVQSNKFTQNANKSSGSKMPRADWNYVSEVIFTVPPLEEQQKIASILSTWDKAIELKEKLIEQKKEQKKGLMQKLLTGRVRLPGFKGEWKKISLNKFIQEYKEKSTMPNQFPILTSSRNGLMLQSEYYSNRQVTTNDNVGYNIIPRGFITYRSRSDDGKFVFNKNTIIDHGIVSYFYPVFKFNDKVCEDFILELLNYTIERQASSFVEGTAQKVLSIKKLGSFKYLIPTIEEQKAIARRLILASKEVTLLESEVDALKQQKQGLMQQLLTGKVRVKV